MKKVLNLYRPRNYATFSSQSYDKYKINSGSSSIFDPHQMELGELSEPHYIMGVRFSGVSVKRGFTVIFFQSAGTHSSSKEVFISWVSDSISLHSPYTIISLRMASPWTYGLFPLQETYQIYLLPHHNLTHVCTLKFPLVHLLIMQYPILRAEVLGILISGWKKLFCCDQKILFSCINDQLKCAEILL